MSVLVYNKHAYKKLILVSYKHVYKLVSKRWYNFKNGNFQQSLALFISEISYCWPKIIPEMESLGEKLRGYQISANLYLYELKYNLPKMQKNHFNLASIKWNEFEMPIKFYRIV